MNLKELRIKFNKTQQELAEICNVRSQTVSSWETGRTKMPDVARKQLADLFGIDEKEIETPSNEDTEPHESKAQLRRDHLKTIMNDVLPDKGKTISESLIRFINALQYFNDQTDSDVFYEQFQIERAANYTAALIDALTAFVFDCGSILALQSSEDVRALETDLGVLRDTLNQLIRYCLKATENTLSVIDSTDDEELKRQQEVYVSMVRSFVDKYSTPYRLNPAEEQRE